MTDKQARFCEEYMIDLNATQAAIRAGYSPKTANEQAARLLANVSIPRTASHSFRPSRAAAPAYPLTGWCESWPRWRSSTRATSSMLGRLP